MELELQNSRIDRIENKIDKLTELVVALARIEEQISDLGSSRDKIESRITDLEIMQSVTSRDVDSHDRILQSITKLLWIAVTGLITAGIAALVITG